MSAPFNTISVRETAKDIITRESKALDQIALQMDHNLGDEFARAVEIIMACQGNVIVSGMGKAGLIGMKVSATMASVGIRGFFLHPSEALHGDLGRVGPKDTLLALSQSGETEELTKILPYMLKNNIPVIAVTSRPRSTLGSVASLVLSLGDLKEADHLNLAPSTSAVAMLAIGDALAFTICQMRGFRENDFAVNHPGGSLGRKLSMVADHMRPLSRCRFANEDDTLRHILCNTVAAGQRCGVILLRNANGWFSGLFTDSDLRRLLEQGEITALDRPIKEVMTKQPQTVQTVTLMSEAIDIMSERKISELPVLDDSHHLVGLLDVTDIISLVPEEMYMPITKIEGTIPFIEKMQQKKVA
jgi:arabinose-5-phosphate isomerase